MNGESGSTLDWREDGGLHHLSALRRRSRGWRSLLRAVRRRVAVVRLLRPDTSLHRSVVSSLRHAGPLLSRSDNHSQRLTLTLDRHGRAAPPRHAWGVRDRPGAGTRRDGGG